MEPVPTWVRVLAVAVAVMTALGLGATVVAGILGLTSVNAHEARATAFRVGTAPSLQIDAELSQVVVEAGQDGRVEVSSERTASALTRSSAASALGRSTIQASQQGDKVVVSQVSPLFPTAVSRSADITVRAPIHTDVVVASVGNLQLRGIDGVVRVDSAGEAELTDVTLRDGSALNVPAGRLAMRNVTVSGAVTVSKQVGDVQFDGTLTPGGSSLGIDAGTGSVVIALPHPTDARAAVVTQTGNLNADPVWHFAPEETGTLHRWTADLGPDPKGTVTVRTSVGNVEFDVR